MSCKLEFKDGTFELTEETRKCLARELEIWEAKKLLREIGVLPLTKSNEWPLSLTKQNSLFDTLNQELIMENIYSSGRNSKRLSLISIIKKHGIAEEALSNFSSKLQKYQDSLNERLKC